MDRNLALEFVRVTEAAAISAAKWIGSGDKNAADGAAVDAMRSRLNQIDFAGTVVIGEGKKDKAPMLYTGEKFGKGKNPAMDLAIDPLECTNSVAHGRYNAMSVIAAGAKKTLLNAPDTYMEKIAVGQKAKKVIDLEAPVKENIIKVAKALGKSLNEITVLMLDRERHYEIIKEIRKIGARVRLITDGDVAGAIAPSLEDSNIDILMGTGASAEAVLAATAIKILGGEILARFKPLKDEHTEELKKAGIYNLKKIYTAEDLAKGKMLTFTATGIIEGPLLKGVEFKSNSVITHSIVIRGISGTIRYITTHHHHHNI
ncbi:fructose-bisphosphatase, class II [Candidatus Roizmanbacteria bacterium RIFCSPHIGHO2_01_FULL_35_10]|uniref:Fructose-1,6-bisphosphatase n=1 Tax=Candidatus Roizmanbacteria bacterium RIFCSPLOWO2_01_FULL_35_13 TaxID=1802055 RepID=A0A1F7IA84_9BACT|nr:MAG: fructose-bisphosphatase, class II [Candidatus Roizmanbacteria bacterium RIFCSPHIGHO2_01_FULL_35_10]OGK40257.1 MAG: fructose-bisphosphatase, class II [Candidatus Roizmanbacteria bacterium RIFCSPLOWO2_01_FULL_35_13]